MTSDSVVFDRAASFYDETRGFPPGEERSIAALISRVGHLGPDSRVFEIGIGTGRIALPLARHVRAVYGIDLSRPMLDRLCAKQTGEPVFPVLGDALRLPFAAGTFDAAVAVHIFHLIAGWAVALREVARVLRPERPLIMGWNQHVHHSGSMGMDALQYAWDAEIHPDRQRRPGIEYDQQDTFLDDQGWRPLGERQVHSYTIIQTPREYIDRLERRVWSSLWNLTDEEIARGIAAVRAEMACSGIESQQQFEHTSYFAVAAYLPPAA